jgi:hypothetical protein
MSGVLLYAPPVRRGPIIVNGARIELIDRGHGRPILFLHPHIGGAGPRHAGRK